jgi:hypothetical protein
MLLWQVLWLCLWIQYNSLPLGMYAKAPPPVLCNAAPTFKILGL